nr:hypothetical protein [Tanacetum cinerariifolium]
MSHALPLTLFGLVTGDHLSRSGTRSWVVELAPLAAVCVLLFLRSCGSHVPHGRIPVMLLVGRSLLVRFGPFHMLVLGLMFILWPELAARLTIYVIMSPQSSVSFVCTDDITKLKSAWLLAANGIVCVPRMLLGASSETEATERAFEAQAEKGRTLMRFEELRFLATSTKDLDDDDAYWIKKQKRLIKNKMRNDLGDEDDEDEKGRDMDEE